jgi:hypothetical protein
MSADEYTPYGFNWGPAKVFRVFQHRERRILAVETGHRRIQISISPTGRSVRVWRDGKELT